MRARQVLPSARFLLTPYRKVGSDSASVMLRYASSVWEGGSGIFSGKLTWSKPRAEGPLETGKHASEGMDQIKSGSKYTG